MKREKTNVVKDEFGEQIIKDEGSQANNQDENNESALRILTRHQAMVQTRK